MSERGAKSLVTVTHSNACAKAAHPSVIILRPSPVAAPKMKWQTQTALSPLESNAPFRQELKSK